MKNKRDIAADYQPPAAGEGDELESLDASAPNGGIDYAKSQYYPIESLEVHEQGELSARVVSDSQATQHLGSSLAMSRRKALIVSVVITVVITLLTGVSMVLLARNSPKKTADKKAISAQDVSLQDAALTQLPSELQGKANSLLVNGDIITRGTIKISDGSFVSVLRTQNANANQTLTLPNASGTVCLDINNCSFATSTQIVDLQKQIQSQVLALSQISVPPAGVSDLNSQKGSVSIQGSLNQISVNTGGGVITVSTPQNLDANANVQFGNLAVASSGVVRANTLQQTAAGNNVAVNAGNDGIIFTANGTTFTLPAGGGPTQTICTTGVTCASGGGQAVLLAPTSAQVDTAADASIFINDTGGGQLLQLQRLGVDKLVVTNSGDVTVGGSLTVSGLTAGFVKSNGTGQLSVVTAIDLSSSEVANTLPIGRGGTGATTFAANGVLTGNGVSPITAVTAGAAGQCLVSTAGAPSFQACPGSGSVGGSGTAGKIAKFTGAGLTIGDSILTEAGTLVSSGGSFNAVNGYQVNGAALAGQYLRGDGTNFVSSALQAADLNGTVAVTKGGTGITTYTTGDILYASSSSALSNLTVGGNGTCLMVAAGLPAWQACTTSSFSLAGSAGAPQTISNGDTVTIAKGTSNNLTTTAGATDTVTIDIIASPSFTALTVTGLSNGLVTTSGGVLNGGAVDRNSGTYFNTLLSAANGGTGNGFTAFSGPSTSTKTFTLPDANATILTTNAAVTVGQGGTGITTYTVGDLLYASGASTLGKLADVAVGSCLVSGGVGTAPAWSTCPGAGGVASLNGQTGAINLANASGSGGTVTIDDATTAAKGIASFNSSFFSTSAGAVSIASSAITSNELANNSVITAKIADNSVTNIKLQNSSLTVTAGNGLSGGGSVALGGSSTALTVNYGSSSTSAVRGDTTLTCATGTGNLTGGGETITLGTGGSPCSALNTVASPIFSGTVTVQGATVSIGTNVLQGGLVLNSGAGVGTNHTGTVKVAAALGQDSVYTIPDVGANATVCVLYGASQSNCTGTGGGITGVGTAGKLPKYTGAGSTIGDSSLSEAGTTLTATGNLVIQGANALTIGVAGPAGVDGAVVFYNAAGGKKVTLQAPSTNPGADLVFKLPSAYGSANDCLKSDGLGGLSFVACTGGGGGGVTSLNSQTGIVLVANASGSGGTVTIDNAAADGATKGIATFNSTNFSAASGVINTIQNINSGASPTFSALTLGSFTAGLVKSDGSGVLSSSSIDRNSSTYFTSTVLSASNGGTGNAFTGFTGPTTSVKTFTLPDASATILTTNSAVTAGQGGTGISSYTVGDLLYASGVSTLSKLADVASGSCLVSGGVGTAPSWAVCPGSGGVASVNSLTGALLVQGTTNQIIVTDNGSSTITLALPQSINTSNSPQFTGLKLTGIGGLGVVHSDASGLLSSSLVVLGTDTSGDYVADFTAGGGLTGSASGVGSNPTLAIGAGNGITVNADDITLALQANKGLEVDTNGLSLIDCTTGQLLKYNGSNQWACAADAGAGGLGDNVLVNGTNAADANFTDTIASGTNVATSWILGTGPTPNTISLALGAASATDAGIVTTGVQTLAGVKTFTDLLTANGGLTITTGQNFTVNGDVFTDLTGTGLTIGAGALQTTLGTSVDLTSEVNGTLPVANGGTGVGTFTSNGVLYGNGTGALQVTAAGTTNQCFLGNTGAAPSFGTCPSGPATTLQQAYAASTGGTTSEILLDATRGALDVQDRSTSNGGTIGANLLNVRATAANDATAGSLLFGIGNTGAATFQNSANSTTAFQVQNAAGTSILDIDSANQLVGIGTASPVSKLHVQGSAAVSGTGTISSTGTMVTGSGTSFTTALHVGDIITASGQSRTVLAIGSNTSLSTDTAFAPGISAGSSFTFSQSILRLTDSSGTARLIQSSLGTTLLQVANDNISALTLRNSDGTSGVELRSGGSGLANTYIGFNAGVMNTTGHDNTAVGYNAFSSNTSGFDNTALGSNALGSNDTGRNNTAFGWAALVSNTSGIFNNAIGQQSLQANTSGIFNTSVGGLYSNITGNNNTSLGISAGNANITGSSNTFIGFQAGDSTGLATGTPTLFPTLINLQNATAIGANAQVQASNSLILGGAGTEAVNVGIGTTNPTNVLSVSPYQLYNNAAAASQTTNTVTETGGTDFTSAMVGSEIVFVDGTKATITGFTSSTVVTVSPSQTVASQKFRVHYAGLQVTSTGNVGIGISTPSRKLDVTGTIGGNVITTTTSDSSTASTVSTAALAYYVESTDTTGDCNTADKTFNITGLPNTEGTFAYIVSKATDNDCTSNSVDVTVQINGSTIGTVTAANTVNGSVTENYTVAYINGAWRIVGLNSGTAQGANGADTADLAEWIKYTGTQPTAGDVLTLGDSPVTAKQSAAVSSPSILGVVSTTPHTVLGADDGHSVILALTGRVPVKVSLEGGPIQAGDKLTSSSTPGVAMKATQSGQIIGTALENYDGTQATAVVMTQLGVGYYAPPATSNDIQGNSATLNSLNVSGEATVGSLTVAGTTTTKDLVVTNSASINNLTVINTTTTKDLTVTNSATIETLTVKDATVTGKLTVSGHIITANASGTTTVAGGAAACTTPTVTLAGNDTAGTITVTTGTGCAATGTLATISFANAFASAPRVVISPDNLDATNLKYYTSGRTTAVFNLSTNSTPVDATTYIYNYQVLQ